METWSTSSSRPNWATAAALSPPPTTLNPLVSATAWATVFVPAANRSSSNTPMGPFQKTVRASRMTSLKRPAVSGPMSSPFHPVGRSVPRWRTSSSGPRADDVGRQMDRLVRLEEAPAVVDLVGLEKRVADLVALGREEGEAHAAADGERVDDPEQRVDDTELVAHLRPAEHRHEWPGRVVAEAEEHLDLLGQQPAGGAGQELRRPHDRGVGPVRCTEGVIDVGVEPVDQPFDELGIVGLLPRVVPQVLQQLHPGASSPSRRRTGSTEYFGSGLPLGRPRWVHAVTSAP